MSQPDGLWQRKLALAAGVVIGCVVLITFVPALRLSFYGDDYSFVEKAGRSSLWEYLTF